MESDRSESRKASEGSQTLSDPIAVRSINAYRRANNMPRSILVAPRAEYECFCSAQPCLTPVPELSAVTSLAHFFLGFLKVSYTPGSRKVPLLAQLLDFNISPPFRRSPFPIGIRSINCLFNGHTLFSPH